MLALTSLKITGTGAVVSLSTIRFTSAKQVILLAPTGNSAPILIGGPEVSSTVGFPIAAGTDIILRPVAPSNPAAPDSNRWDISEFKAYIANGDVLDVLLGG